MSSFRMRKTGNWTGPFNILQRLQSKLKPAFIARLQEDGEMVLDKMVGHIDAQDLNWTPLAESTIQLKGGNDTILVETGFLHDNLKVKKVKSKSKGATFFIGADNSTTTPDGHVLSDLMIWLEYGTDRLPPRPLIRPTWEEVESILKDNWENLVVDLVGGKF